MKTACYPSARAITAAMAANSSPPPAASGLAQDQIGGGDVPVMRVRLHESGVERAAGDHRQTIGQRGNVGGPVQPLPPVGRQLVDEGPGAGHVQLLARLCDRDRAAVEEGASTRQRRIGLASRRAFQHAGDGPPALDHGDADAPCVEALQETARAVDGIDDEGAAGQQPGRVVRRFFRKPAIIRAGGKQRLAQIGVGRVIGLADGRGAALHPHLRVLAEIAQGDRTRFVRRLAQQVHILAGIRQAGRLSFRQGSCLR